MTYAEQLLSPKWQRKRLSILKRDNFTCQCCGDTETTLHIHHKKYLPRIKAWEYNNKLLITVCSHCHEYIHRAQGILKNDGWVKNIIVGYNSTLLVFMTSKDKTNTCFHFFCIDRDNDDVYCKIGLPEVMINDLSLISKNQPL